MAHLFDFDSAFDSLSAFISTHDLEKGLTENEKLAQIVEAIATINDNIDRVHQRLSEMEKSLEPMAAQKQTKVSTSTQTHSWFDAGERMKIMEEEKENQRRAVDQIGDQSEDKRPW